MDPFADLEHALTNSGPAAAVDALIADRRAAGDFQGVFYARLMQARLGFGAPPFPDGPAGEIPAEHHEAYEEAIRAAAREAGSAHLERHEFREGWAFFRMIGEAEPVRRALADYAPDADADVSSAVEVAWHHAVDPEKGFDLVLDRSGLCAAITMVQSTDLSGKPAAREHAVRRLVRALREQIGDAPADDFYVDPSHLLSVCQLAMHLPPCPEVATAGGLCGYGERLPADLRGRDDPPFDATYTDYRRYLDVVGGTDVDGGLAHFRAKCEAGAADGYRFPAEVLVGLLDRAGRAEEALAVARQQLADADERSLSCPGPLTLAKKRGDYRAAAEITRRRGDRVGWVASRIAAGGR